MEQEASSSGGYDMRFLGNTDRWQCPVCLFVIRKAMQTSCGHRFCKTCITTVIGKSTMLRCPVDKQFSKLEQIFPDVAFRRDVLSLAVRCNHDSCPWIGDLSDYEAHKQICTMEDVECPFGCGIRTVRCEFQRHTETCPCRETICEYCRVKVQHHHMESHLEECSKFPVTCTLCNEDGILREDLDAHIDGDEGSCPEAVIGCPYSPIGCSFSSRRVEMNKHLIDVTSIAGHLSTLSKTMSDYQNTLQEFREEITRLNGRLEVAEGSSARTDRRIDGVRRELSTRNMTGQLHWKIEIRGGRADYFSPAFYSGCPGYKVQIEMDTGNARDNCIRFGLAVQRGDYDDQIMWPFNALCYVTILDQKPGNKPKNMPFNFTLRDVPRNRNGTRTDRLYKRAMPKLSKKDEILGHGSRFVKNGYLYVEVSVVHCVYPIPDVAGPTITNISPVALQALNAPASGTSPAANSTPVLNLSSFLMTPQ